jgi:hypothetical protein
VVGRRRWFSAGRIGPLCDGNVTDLTYEPYVRRVPTRRGLTFADDGGLLERSAQQQENGSTNKK